MPHLLLYDWQWQLVGVNMMHDMTVSQRVDGDQVKFTPFRILSVFAAESSLDDVALEYLPDPVLAVTSPRPS